MIERPNDHDDEYRVRRSEVRLLSIPEHRFVMVEGSGPAGGEAFEARMPGLYGVAYGLRSALKRRGVRGEVRPLEGLWWHAGGATDLNEILAGDRSAWRWTLMIVVPMRRWRRRSRSISRRERRRSSRRSRPRFVLSRSRRAMWRRCCTSGHTPRSEPRSSDSTRASPRPDSDRGAAITSCTSGTRDGLLPIVCAPSSVSRSSPDGIDVAFEGVWSLVVAAIYP